MLSRRNLLKLMAVTGAASSLPAGLGCHPGDDPGSSGEAITDATTEFDYIVIGSGAGGGPVACRLAEAGFTVCLIEAGGDRGKNRTYQVPAYHGQSTEDPSMQWDYFVDHYADKEQAQRDPKRYQERNGDDARKDRRKGVYYPRAGTLGGCTAHNAMITIRPHEADWDDLARITGDVSWSAKNMKQFFKAFENCTYVKKEDTVHGKNGWLVTKLPDDDTLKLSLKTFGQRTIADVLFWAAVSTRQLPANAPHAGSEQEGRLHEILKADVNVDIPNRDNLEGLFSIPLAVKDGYRNGTREYILKTAQERSDKLRLMMNTFVTRLDFKRDENDALFRDANGNLVATGLQAVTYDDGAQVYRASPNAKDGVATKSVSLTARREIIVAAGAFNTPQILMLSGIGPKKHLQDLGIECLVDLPGVGGNLQDRYEVCVIGDHPEGQSFDLLAACTFAPEGKADLEAGDACLKEWNEHHDGPYAGNKCFGGVVKRSAAAAKVNGPSDLVVFGLHSSFYGYFPGYTIGQTPQGYEKAPLHGPPNSPTTGKPNARARMSWAVLKGHTGNTAGYVRLRSKDPFEVPEINFKYFHEGTTSAVNPNTAGPKTINPAEEDLQAVYEGVQLARDIITKAGLNEAGPMQGFTTEQAVKDFIKNNAWGHHASCTCPMGPMQLKEADTNRYVLNPKLEVRGTKGLRVVDASIFPKIPGLFIVSAIYMASEKAAAMLIKEARSEG